jgi:beta-lactamase class A
VANKTGGVSGTSNDAAIVYTAFGAPIVLVVYCKGLSQSATGGASRAIADIAAELYAHLGEPA